MYQSTEKKNRKKKRLTPRSHPRRGIAFHHADEGTETPIASPRAKEIEYAY